MLLELNLKLRTSLLQWFGLTIEQSNDSKESDIALSVYFEKESLPDLFGTMKDSQLSGRLFVLAPYFFIYFINLPIYIFNQIVALLSKLVISVMAQLIYPIVWLVSKLIFPEKKSDDLKKINKGAVEVIISIPIFLLDIIELIIIAAYVLLTLPVLIGLNFLTAVCDLFAYSVKLCIDLILFVLFKIFPNLPVHIDTWGNLKDSFWNIYEVLLSPFKDIIGSFIITPCSWLLIRPCQWIVKKY